MDEASANAREIAALARLSGLTLFEDEAREIADRFFALLRELECLSSMPLADVEPLVVFHDEGADGG